MVWHYADPNWLQQMMSFTPCFGAIFYFFESPSEIREEIRSAVRAWQMLWPGSFSRISTTGDSFRAFPRSKTIDEYVVHLLADHNFDRSLFFTVFDTRDDHWIEQQLLFWGVTSHPDDAVNTPNYLYVQVPSRVPLDDCREAFRDTMDAIPIHLALGNYMIPRSPEGGTRGGSQACRYLRDSTQFIHEFSTTFRNRSYLRLLEQRGSKFLAHPSQFIGLGPWLAQLAENTIETANAVDGFAVASRTKYSSIEIISDVGLQRSVEVLQPHFGEVQKPRMFWKPAEWDSWLNRVRGDGIGRLVAKRSTN